MNQLKNGTIFVVIATIIAVILMLNTERDDANTSTEKTIVKLEDSAALEQIEAPKTETLQIPEEAPEIISEITENLPVVDGEITLAKAPEGPFKKSTTNLSDNTNVVSALTTSTQHDVLNHITQPIWMDQKLGDFKSVKNNEVVFKLMPSNSDGLQGENPAQVITSKKDKFAPSSIPANYNYQQMPMYNGGYYIAPMPSYLMSSMLPSTVIIKNDAKTEN